MLLLGAFLHRCACVCGQLTGGGVRGGSQVGIVIGCSRNVVIIARGHSRAGCVRGYELLVRQLASCMQVAGIAVSRTVCARIVRVRMHACLHAITDPLLPQPSRP